MTTNTLLSFNDNAIPIPIDNQCHNEPAVASTHSIVHRVICPHSFCQFWQYVLMSSVLSILLISAKVAYRTDPACHLLKMNLSHFCIYLEYMKAMISTRENALPICELLLLHIIFNIVVRMFFEV